MLRSVLICQTHCADPMGTVRRPRWSDQAIDRCFLGDTAMGSAIATIVLIGLIWIVGLLVSVARPRGSQHAATHALRRNSGVTTHSGYGGWAPPNDPAA